MPIITRIAETRRRPNWRQVYLDGKPAFGCSVNVIARFRLRPSMELTEEQVQRIRRGQVRQSCFDAAMGFLQRRLHSRAELQRKLSRKEFDASTVEQVLDDLQRLGYVDDARFARTRAMSAAQHRHHGRHRARVDLLRSGVEPETARRAVEDVYDAHDSLSVARALVGKQVERLRRLGPAVARRRLAGMLQRRGFDYDTIRPVIDEALGHEQLHDETGPSPG